jgi:hypothetical protein
MGVLSGCSGAGTDVPDSGLPEDDGIVDTLASDLGHDREDTWIDTPDSDGYLPDVADDSADADPRDPGMDAPDGVQSDDGPDIEPPPDRACNGSDDLCARPYDFVVFATTHNAMATQDDGWVAPNQTLGIRGQLDAGVRGLMLDIHMWDNSGEEPEGPWLCHSECFLGNRRLVEGLVDIRDFMEANPREVVTIIFESYVDGDIAVQAFQDAGLLPMLHEQAPGDPWPTLGRMIETGQRLVVLTDRQGGAAPWYLPVWSHAWETHWSASKPEDLNCAGNRGDNDNALFILNHFLSDPIALPRLAEQINNNPFLMDRALICRQESRRQPNFLTVDFCEIGDVFTTADVLNSVPWHPMDDVLRLNHLQMVGTHNSYHVAPDPPSLPQWDYSHDPLDEQLQWQSVRSVELDIHVNPDGGFDVFHFPLADEGTNCRDFAVCLGLLKTWSDAHPWHVPLFVLLEPKDDVDDQTLEDRYDDIDAAILAVWPAERLVTPDDIRGEHASIRQALETDGWPLLGEVRGKAIFVMLDEKTHRDGYMEGRPNLEGRVMFARGGRGQPWGAILEHGNPQRDEAVIRSAVDEGYLVRTSVGDPGEQNEVAAERLVAALRSGAHVISTDYPVARQGRDAVALPDGAPARCNPVTAPSGCRSGDVE